MNNARLSDIIDAKGIKRTFICEKMDISYPTFTRRLNGDGEWTVSQVSVLVDILGLSKSEAYDIFFK